MNDYTKACHIEVIVKILDTTYLCPPLLQFAKETRATLDLFHGFLQNKIYSTRGRARMLIPGENKAKVYLVPGV